MKPTVNIEFSQSSRLSQNVVGNVRFVYHNCIGAIQNAFSVPSNELIHSCAYHTFDTHFGWRINARRRIRGYDNLAVPPMRVDAACDLRFSELANGGASKDNSCNA